jgi:hypothetical protein
MRIEGSSISCGVRRLVIDKNEKPTKEQLSTLIKNNHSCAVVVAGVPSRRRGVIALLLDSGFEQIKNPNKVEQSIDTPNDDSINPAFADMVSLIMRHGNELQDIDDSVRFEQFVENTITNDLANMATLVLHHGNELIGNLSFFIRYMGK